jgi:hypothetical protein
MIIPIRCWHLMISIDMLSNISQIPPNEWTVFALKCIYHPQSLYRVRAVGRACTSSKSNDGNMAAKDFTLFLSSAGNWCCFRRWSKRLFSRIAVSQIRHSGNPSPWPNKLINDLNSAESFVVRIRAVSGSCILIWWGFWADSAEKVWSGRGFGRGFDPKRMANFTYMQDVT